MSGIDRKTGKVIGRADHIAQSIEVILTTPRGSRVMRREIGFDVLKDDGTPKFGLSSATIEASARKALDEYEPQIEIVSISQRMSNDLLSSITVRYRDREDGKPGTVVVKYSV